MNFNEFGIDSSILRALKEIGYVTPTPIQEKAIPVVLAGRDLVGCAQTGTGKTAAFSIPLLQRMGKPEPGQARPVRALILTPTRELALQIYENICQYGRYTGRVAAVIYGGVSQIPQVEALHRGVDILIATPGRLWDLMGQKLVDIGEVECFILDEADRMLDMGFLPDVRRIIDHLPRKRQTLLFSATMPEEIATLARGMLHHPAEVSVTPAATPVETIEQGVYFAEKAEKRALLQAVLRQKGLPQTLVFSRTKHGADRIARDLNRAGISARALHGDKSQGARQTALKAFKENKIVVLVATDIAARGLDISELPLVINFDLPNIPETYVHRIGRTGRAGMDGTALSFCAQDEQPYLKDIEKLTYVVLPRLSWPDGVTIDVPVDAAKVAIKVPVRHRTEHKRKALEESVQPIEETRDQAKRKQRTVSQNVRQTGRMRSGRNAPTEALAQKYPNTARPAGGTRRTGGARRRDHARDDLSVDISTPRTHELSEEAAARVRIKIQRKLAERAAIRQKAGASSEAVTSSEGKKAAVRRVVRRGRKRTSTKN